MGFSIVVRASEVESKNSGDGWDPNLGSQLFSVCFIVKVVKAILANTKLTQNDENLQITVWGFCSGVILNLLNLFFPKQCLHYGVLNLFLGLVVGISAISVTAGIPIWDPSCFWWPSRQFP